MMAQGPLYGDARSSHGISVDGGGVTPKIDVQSSTPISCPQRFELAISRMKRGGVEFVIASHIPQASLVWSVLLCMNAGIDAYTPVVPLHWTLHPWSNTDAPEDIWRTALSFPITQLRGVSAVCCLASSRQSTLCGTFSVSLLPEVCSSRAMVVHLSAQLTWLYKGKCPLQEWWEKVSFGRDLMSVPSAHSSWGMTGCLPQPDTPLCTVPFPSSPFTFLFPL